VKKEFEFIRKLRAGCLALGLSELDNDVEEQLHRYFMELKRWSQKVNLIAKGTGDDEILEKHFLDSLTVLPFLSGENPHLLDIGTGAGFPGLVCKIAMPELRVTLVEPRFRRVSFLRHVIRTLQLEDVTVLECRAEDEEKLPSESGFTHICSRAVSDIQVFLAMCSRFAKPETKVICMKGPKWKEELDLYLAEDSEQTFTLLTAKQYVLPESKSLRNVMVFDSI
jgi:16S rRNA (guanine527-N7)-methyltransferase